MRAIYILLFILISSCSSQNLIKHSFFVAGHTYGNPLEKGKVKGLYKPFKDKFQFIKEQKNIKRGFLLGDVVWSKSSWPEAQNDISRLEIPVYIARGNHDGPLKQFEDKFGKSYSSFLKDESLFIILDPNLDEWNISNEQLIFLKNKLRIDGKKAKNIFVFSHQVLWWTNNKFSKPFPNSLHHKSKKTNYWSQIEPLFKELDKPVFLFAGDVGAFSKEHRKSDHVIEYFYHKDRNITYISTGMGGGVRDNFVIVDVLNDGTVKFRLIHLNGDNLNGLGKLEDYINPN